MFRKLRADEIEVRVGSVSLGKGVSLLLYKDARCDMAILDETVGSLNWQRNHELVNNNLFCNVGIRANRDDTRVGADWVWKQDVGTESNTEKEKGEASDSFKRACFCWGIGRELYTGPFIWIDAKNIEWREQKGKEVPKDKFVVTHISYIDNKISELKISTKKGKEVFTFAPTKARPEVDPEHICCICGKQLTKTFFEKSVAANGQPYCSKTCLQNDAKNG